MSIFVVAKDNGTEGHGLPYLAFTDKDAALKWCACHGEAYSVAEVPIYPEFPLAPWWEAKKITA